MPVPNGFALRRALIAGAFLILACGFATAHQSSAPEQAQAPAVGAAVETLTGTMAQLIVDNRVTGVTTRHVALRTDDGRSLALLGAGFDTLSERARVQVSGRTSRGNTFFVTESAVVSPASTRSLVARSQGLSQVQGTLVLAHSDNFVERTGLFFYVVRGDDGVDVPLKLPLMPDTLQGGMRVIASGAPASDGFSLDTDHISVLSLAAPDRPIANSTTNNVLVILVKFTDSPAPPFTAADVDAVFRNGSGGLTVTNYYNDVSYGQHLLNVTVTSTWLDGLDPDTQVPIATPANCNFPAVGYAADAAADQAGYIGFYQNRFYVMPHNTACNWAGLGYIGIGRAWNNGSNDLGDYAHELGHNFGLYHAGSLSCPGQIIGGPCTGSEYGDIYSVMGAIGAMHFNSAQKSKLHWFPGGTVQTHISGSVSYTLSPIESTGGATYAVKIPAATTRQYWVEYRKSIGFDAGVPSDGVQVRVGSPLEQPAACLTGPPCNDSEILDMSAGGGAYTLNVGQTFIDRATGVTINPTSQGANSLHVTVGKVNVPMLGDFDNDGSSDILWQSPSDRHGAFWFMKLGALSNSSFFKLPQGWIPQAVGDIDGDGKADIIWTNPGSNLVAIWFMDGATISSAAYFGLSSTWSIAAVGDFNGDGRADILWRNVNGQVASWLMNGSTIQSVVYYSNVDASWTVLGTGDFFGDGKSEVLWKHSPDGAIYLWRNVDQATPQLIPLGAPGGTWAVAAIGDFNGDGNADLFLRDAAGNNAIWPSGLSSAAVVAPHVGTPWSVIGARQLYGEGRSNILWRNNTGTLAQWRFNAALVPTGTFLPSVPLTWSPVGQ